MSDPNKEKPRLTEQEKKSNHIASEQKRRQAIREGYDRVADITPGMKGQGRSEALVLNAAIEFANRCVTSRVCSCDTADALSREIAEQHRLVAQAESQGINVDDLKVADLEPPLESNGVNGNSGAGGGI